MKDYLITLLRVLHRLYRLCIAATGSGLNRYNGGRFTQFHSNSDSLSMASEELTEWYGLINIGLEFSTGLHIVDTRTGKTQPFSPYHNKQI
jgi:hypothetical protein